MLDHWEGIDTIEGQLEDHYSTLPSAKREQFWEHLVYLANNKDSMSVPAAPRR